MEKEKWLEKKAKFYKRMIEDREIGYLDPGIETLLEKFFEKEGLFTTSSCIGRITIVEGKHPWERDTASIVYKIHGEITEETIKKYMNMDYNYLWLRVTGPIIHVSALNEEWAKWVIEIARKAGFKHSCIFSIGEDILVEIMSSIQVTFPLKVNNIPTISDKALGNIVKVANELWNRGVESAKILEKLLETHPF